MSSMNPVYFYVYLLLIITSLLLFTISRCYFKINTFDSLFYPNENNLLLENKVFLSFHILINFLLGALFGFDVLYAMLFKIIAIESYLYFTEHCDIFKVAPISSLIITILISIISYFFGALFSKGVNSGISSLM